MTIISHKGGRKRFCLRVNECCGNHDYFHFFRGIVKEPCWLHGIILRKKLTEKLTRKIILEFRFYIE